jgi:hypothetical protein
VLPEFPTIHLNVLATHLERLGGYEDVVLHFLRFANEGIRNSVEALQQGDRLREGLCCKLMDYLQLVTVPEVGDHE